MTGYTGTIFRRGITDRVGAVAHKGYIQLIIAPGNIGLGNCPVESREGSGKERWMAGIIGDRNTVVTAVIMPQLTCVVKCALGIVRITRCSTVYREPDQVQIAAGIDHGRKIIGGRVGELIRKTAQIVGYIGYRTPGVTAIS